MDTTPMILLHLDHLQPGFSILGMVSDFKFQFTNLLFLLPPVAKAIYDVYYTEFRHFPVLHKQSLAYAVTMGAAIACIDWQLSPVTYFWQSALLGITVHYLIFDYLRNIMARKPFFYMDLYPESDHVEDSWVDTNLYKKIPSPKFWLLTKLWLFTLAFSTYYFSSYIW